VLRWWARWLPTPQNAAGLAELPAGGGRGTGEPEPVEVAVDGEATARRSDTIAVPATRLR
jgi:hypothetical protein